MKFDQLKNRLDQLKITKKIDFADFELGPSWRKCLGFQSNISKYKRKTLTMFWRVLEDLWVISIRSERFYYLLTLQVSKGIKSTIKCLWNLVVVTRSTTSDLSLWVGSQSHKCGELVFNRSKREKSVESELACDRVNMFY